MKFQEDTATRSSSAALGEHSSKAERSRWASVQIKNLLQKSRAAAKNSRVSTEASASQKHKQHKLSVKTNLTGRERGTDIKIKSFSCHIPVMRALLPWGNTMPSVTNNTRHDGADKGTLQGNPSTTMLQQLLGSSTRPPKGYRGTKGLWQVRALFPAQRGRAVVPQGVAVPGCSQHKHQWSGPGLFFCFPPKSYEKCLRELGRLSWRKGGSRGTSWVSTTP